jgi:hypothetical protein
MKNNAVKLWFLVTITLFVIALTMRMGWALYEAIAPGTYIICILIILATLGIYAAVIYFTYNPDFKKLKTPPFQIGFSAILIAALVAGVIHAYRFIPSPQANIPISIPMALLLLASETSICILLIYLLWRK